MIKLGKNIIAIVGGMGNQMFQYALSLSIDKRGKVELNDCLAKNGKSNYGAALICFSEIAVTNHLSSNFFVWFVRKCVIFSLKKNFSEIALLAIRIMNCFGIRIITDYNPRIKENFPRKPFITVYYGRFQSENYFTGKKEEVKKAFSFDSRKASNKTQKLAETLIRENSVSVHLRRGDYMYSGNIAVFGNICTSEYYKKALKYIKERVENPFFCVFSDDLQYATEHLNLPNAVYVNWNQGVNSWEDMYLMSKCKHNIIANSTFSWWGAWLNTNPEKMVLCPPKYINSENSVDFYPHDWIKMHSE
jgi:hypothetical protein